MYEIMSIGAAPTHEHCAQVGSADYDGCSQRECRVYQRMLERLFPLPESIPAQLIVKSFPHEFGSYREVCVRYQPNDVAACNYAYQLEAESPEHWDAIARYELIWLQRKEQWQQAVRQGTVAAKVVPEMYRNNDLPELPVDRTFNELMKAFPL